MKVLEWAEAQAGPTLLDRRVLCGLASEIGVLPTDYTATLIDDLKPYCGADNGDIMLAIVRLHQFGLVETTAAGCLRLLIPHGEAK